jgi:hypothetical protein
LLVRNKAAVQTILILVNSPSIAELKLKFLREELSLSSALIAELRLGTNNREQAERLLGHVEVSQGSLSNFLSDPARMKLLNDEQQRELREAAEGLRTMLEQARRSLKGKPSDHPPFQRPS